MATAAKIAKVTAGGGSDGNSISNIDGDSNGDGDGNNNNNQTTID